MKPCFVAILNGIMNNKRRKQSLLYQIINQNSGIWISIFVFYLSTSVFPPGFDHAFSVRKFASSFAESRWLYPVELRFHPPFQTATIPVKESKLHYSITITMKVLKLHIHILCKLQKFGYVVCVWLIIDNFTYMVIVFWIR